MDRRRNAADQRQTFLRIWPPRHQQQPAATLPIAFLTWERELRSVALPPRQPSAAKWPELCPAEAEGQPTAGCRRSNAAAPPQTTSPDAIPTRHALLAAADPPALLRIQTLQARP